MKFYVTNHSKWNHQRNPWVLGETTRLDYTQGSGSGARCWPSLFLLNVAPTAPVPPTGGPLLPVCLPKDATLVDGSPCFPRHLCDEGHLVRQDWWQADPLGGLPLLLHLLTLLPFRLIQDGRRQKSWRCQLSDFHPNKVYNLERSAGFDFQLGT